MIFSSVLYDYLTVITMNSLNIPRLDKMKMTWNADLLSTC